MKALCSDTGVANLEVRDLPLPEPGPGEVRVDVHASAVNPADLKVLDGELLGNILHGKARPLVVGWDVSGVVLAVGAGADYAVGDAVFGFLSYARSTKRGAYAESVVVPAANLARRPAHLSDVQAAALATAGVTALQAMRDVGGLTKGQRVLIIGASGGVGALAVGIAVRLGAKVTAVCSASAAELVRGLGATRTVERGQLDALQGTRFHVIFDAAAAHSWMALRGMLEPGGAYVSTLPGPGLFLSMPLAWASGTRVGAVMVAATRADLELLARWVGEGLPVPIDSTFPVRDLRLAIERMRKGGMRGRVVVQVEGGF